MTVSFCEDFYGPKTVAASSVTNGNQAQQLHNDCAINY